MSINCWMDKHNLVHACGRILCSSQEKITDTYNNMGGLKKHFILSDECQKY